MGVPYWVSTMHGYWPESVLMISVFVIIIPHHLHIVGLICQFSQWSIRLVKKIMIRYYKNWWKQQVRLSNNVNVFDPRGFVMTTFEDSNIVYSMLWQRQGVKQHNCHLINTLRSGPNGCHSPDDILKGIFLKFVPKVPIANTPALVQIMTWRQPGDKPLSEPMMHIGVTWSQWVNCYQLNFFCVHSRASHRSYTAYLGSSPLPQ